MKSIKALAFSLERHIHHESQELFEHIALHSYLKDADGDAFVKALSAHLLRRPKTEEERAARRIELMKLLPCVEESWASVQTAETLLGLMKNVLGRERLDGSADLLADERALKNFRFAVSVCLNGDEPSWYRSPEKAAQPCDWWTDEPLV